MKALMTEKDLIEQRESLRLQLQRNRQIIEQKLMEHPGGFPRSIAMRLLMKNKSAAGIGFFRCITFGYSLLTFLTKRRLVRVDHIEHSKSVN